MPEYIVIEVEERVTEIGRDSIVQALHAENILARRYFYPGCHRMEPYRSFSPHAGLLLPETERLARRIVVLPTGTAIGEEEIYWKLHRSAWLTGSMRTPGTPASSAQ